MALVLCAWSAPLAAQRKAPADVPLNLPPLRSATIDDTLAIEGEDIAARKQNTRMTAEVRVNGRGPFRFVVDSGADTSVVGARIARALVLPAGTPANLLGTTATGRVERVFVERLDLGPSAVADLELPVLEERDLGGAGMIGIDALVRQRLMLDFEKRVIRVEDASKPPPRMTGEIVVVARRRRGQLILTQARLNDKPVEAVIDTGSEITIGNRLLRDYLVKRRGQKIETIEVTGVTGITVPMELARVRVLQLGPVLFKDVPIAFADVPPFKAFGLADAPALLLGTDLMETFRRVSLDFRARKVRFQLRRCESQGIVISTSRDMPSRLVLANGGEAACQR